MIIFLLIGVVLVLGGAAFYVFVLPTLNSGPESAAAVSMVAKLRSTPSNAEGMTVGERMNDELERSRRVGNLTAYQGWSIKPIKGSKTRFLIVFSYEEQGNVVRRAEWVADLSTNTFTPTTDLAVAVYNK